MADATLDDIKFVTARRAYEFGPDQLRLSALCTPPVEERLRALFHFRIAAMGSPTPTFGEVPSVFPPGYVFDMGFWLSPEEVLVPIRFIHFEPERIVIDVTGKSDAITPIYDLLWEAVGSIQTPDGSTVIGKPANIREYTEISAHCAFPFDALIAPGVRRILAARNEGMALIPTLAVHATDPKIAFAGMQPAWAFNFAIRVSTRPEEQMCFSSAPLESDAHLEYLQELAQALAG